MHGTEQSKCKRVMKMGFKVLIGSISEMKVDKCDLESLTLKFIWLNVSFCLSPIVMAARVYCLCSPITDRLIFVLYLLSLAYNKRCSLLICCCNLLLLLLIMMCDG